MFIQTGGNQQVQARVIFSTPSTSTWFPPSEEDPDEMTPTDYSNTLGNLSGLINGANDTFIMSGSPTRVDVYLNGSRMIQNVHFSHSGSTVIFVAPILPEYGAEILIVGWQ